MTYQKMIYVDCSKMNKLLLKIEDLHFQYNKKISILNGVNLEVGSSEIIGISGENGSGKSTLLKILVGLLKGQKGSVKEFGRIGYSPQNLLLFDNLTVNENFEVFGKGMNLTGNEISMQVVEILEKLNFGKYKNTLIKNLSGGTKQKVNFGISLMGEPDILVLDEPYQGMDYASFKAFWDMQFEMRKKGRSIIIVSHMIEDQSKFTKSYHLIKGKLQSCNRLDCNNCGVN